MGVYVLCTNPFVHSVLDRSDMKGRGESKYISDRRKKKPRQKSNETGKRNTLEG
jgi:hypothetical protein